MNGIGIRILEKYLFSEEYADLNSLHCWNLKKKNEIKLWAWAANGDYYFDTNWQLSYFRPNDFWSQSIILLSIIFIADIRSSVWSIYATQRMRGNFKIIEFISLSIHMHSINRFFSLTNPFCKSIQTNSHAKHLQILHHIFYRRLSDRMRSTVQQFILLNVSNRISIWQECRWSQHEFARD